MTRSLSAFLNSLVLAAVLVISPAVFFLVVVSQLDKVIRK